MKAYAQGKQIIVNDNASVVQTVVQPPKLKDEVSFGPISASSDHIFVSLGIVVFLVLGWFLIKKITKDQD
tara:strand:+ start:45 stop:254 length:210 start_codon:yes stop_codon:yes gene_type:complete